MAARNKLTVINVRISIKFPSLLSSMLSPSRDLLCPLFHTCNSRSARFIEISIAGVTGLLFRTIY